MVPPRFRNYAPALFSRVLFSQPSPKPLLFRHFRQRSPRTRVCSSGRSVARLRRHFESGGLLFNA
ncbi:hypothetical protein B5K05_33350 [Rhizobium phaseoli]|uniref:Uncharacterized protein n=1 Tax=Rhizobium etli (strain CIAT 652) TaxID=491916 RepID=B3Q226_RHIE6|nr:hypothetical protein RHECIAT_PB0000005 [Rhizobium etli CIAT 652]RDJ00760.1 hypothetical protein B5K05_33350 [Rhizobium phaseoli]RDJ00960.1 hypothetical protein B5K04_31435 [Rhizobium phaseoli]